MYLFFEVKNSLKDEPSRCRKNLLNKLKMTSFSQVSVRRYRFFFSSSTTMPLSRSDAATVVLQRILVVVNGILLVRFPVLVPS